ncbi:MAG: HD domain-containing phosphohydrolase [Planctomycetota bacterium]
MPVLTIKTGPAEGRSFELTGEPQTIGRKGDVQVLDTAVSRKHAEVFELGGVFLIRDLDSRNGTFVNDQRITEETALHPGDRIRLGAAVLEYQAESAADQAVEFVRDQETASTVEIKLGDQAAQVVGEGREASTAGRLLAIYEVARVVGRENTVQGVAEKVLDQAMAAVGPTYCYIFIRNEVSGNLEPKAWRDPAHGKRREISHSIVTRAMRRRHSILTADAASDSRFDQSDSVVIGEIRSVICAPLIARDRINGVLYMGRDASAEPFTDEDLELATAIAFQTGIALENIATHAESQTEMMALVKTLTGAMDLRSPPRRGHGERVAAYAVAIADRLRLSDDDCNDAHAAALLHDIGKVPISENTRLAVSSTIGQNVPEEYCHAFLGAKMLADLPALAPVRPGIQYHHERLDGLGGPWGLAGEDIPLIARIVGVANRFDHLAVDPVRNGQPMPISEALETIEQPGEGLDDAITHALVQAQTTGSGIELPRLVLQDFC